MVSEFTLKHLLDACVSGDSLTTTLYWPRDGVDDMCGLVTYMGVLLGVLNGVESSSFNGSKGVSACK